MQTLKADNRQRVRLPDTKPGQVYVYESNPDGSITLVPVIEVQRKERFPPGSLLKYFTPEKDAEELALLRGCTQEVEE